MIYELIWLGTSLKDARAFSKRARRQLGHALHMVQLGESPADVKPMPSIGKGVQEIRIHAENEYRVIYLARFQEAVYVLHAFTKKTQRTPKRDLDLARRRPKELTLIRRERT